MAEGRIYKKGEVDFCSLIKKVQQNLGGEIGALGCFIGVVRGTSKSGEKIDVLHYEMAEEAAQVLAEIARETESRLGLKEVQIHHVVDDLRPGEESICVIACGKHRKEVFLALSKVMEQVKSRAPIWKKEITASRGHWI